MRGDHRLNDDIATGISKVRVPVYSSGTTETAVCRNKLRHRNETDNDDDDGNALLLLLLLLFISICIIFSPLVIN